jgi:hypothetical protein
VESLAHKFNKGDVVRQAIGKHHWQAFIAKDLKSISKLQVGDVDDLQAFIHDAVGDFRKLFSHQLVINLGLSAFPTRSADNPRFVDIVATMNILWVV